MKDASASCGYSIHDTPWTPLCEKQFCRLRPGWCCKELRPCISTMSKQILTFWRERSDPGHTWADEHFGRLRLWHRDIQDSQDNMTVRTQDGNPGSQEINLGPGSKAGSQPSHGQPAHASKRRPLCDAAFPPFLAWRCRASCISNQIFFCVLRSAWVQPRRNGIISPAPPSRATLRFVSKCRRRQRAPDEKQLRLIQD